MTNEEIIALTKGIVTDFLTQLGLDAAIEVEIEPKDEEISYVFVKLEGDNMSELIGFRGKHLESAQVILSLILGQKLGDRRYRLILDINDYKVNREKDLISYAMRAAGQVKESGQVMELRPMKPYERRIVHMALKKESGIKAESDGEGENRHIIISKDGETTEEELF